jgi:hypothetical protein
MDMDMDMDMGMDMDMDTWTHGHGACSAMQGAAPSPRWTREDLQLYLLLTTS